MRSFTRLLILFSALVALFGCSGTPSSPALVATNASQPRSLHTYANILSPAITMNVARAAHSATLLRNGHVLVAGGFREEGTREIAIASAEIYDPTTNTFQPTGAMNDARSGHTATLLANGNVLVVGGWGPSERTATAELYNYRTGTWTYAASLMAPRASMTATPLQDGRVIIIGGDSARSTPQLVAEVYDPASNTWTQTGSLYEGRTAHTATLLPDGTVLVAGGSPGSDRVLASAERYDPYTGTFVPTGNLHTVRYKHAAVLLPDGNVMLIGGSDERDWTGKYRSTEIYDAQTGKFEQSAPLGNERFKLADAAIRLSDDNLLVGGGNQQMELYDAPRQRFTNSAQLPNNYYYTVLTLLQDGRVLITGGYDLMIQPSTQAWIYS